MPCRTCIKSILVARPPASFAGWRGRLAGDRYFYRRHRGELGLQSEMLDLAHGVARQRLANEDAARQLETCEIGPKMRLDALRHDDGASTRHDERDRRFLPARIGDADHGAFTDLRTFEDHPLDLRRVDVLAARDDEVLLAVAHEEIAVGIDAADIAGEEP